MHDYTTVAALHFLLLLFPFIQATSVHMRARTLGCNIELMEQRTKSAGENRRPVYPM